MPIGVSKVIGLLSFAKPALPSGALAYWNAADYSAGTIPNRVSGASALTVTSGSVSGGLLLHGTYSAVATFNAAQNASAFTLVYLASHSGTPNPDFENIFACKSDYTRLSVGPIPTFNGGTLYNNTQIEVMPGPEGKNADRPNWWGGVSQGPFVAAHRYDGNTASAFINGVRLINNTVSVAAPTAFSDIEVGAVQNNGQHTTYDIGSVVYWPRALSDAEICQAYKYFKTQSILLTQPRTVILMGDSITFGFSATNGNGYAYLMIPNLSPPAFGMNTGVSGEGLGNWTGANASFGALIAAIPAAAIAAGAPSQKFILSVAFGANDLNGGQDPNAYLTTLATFCDTMRAAGHLVVLHSILARNDAGDGGTAFNSRRHTVNTATSGWVGTHIDAYADWASDPTMGTDAAANNASLFNGFVHPTDLGHSLLEPITRAAINGL